MTQLTWLAPAKLNLFLHITGRRTDGYHQLQTVFQFLDYSDELSFTLHNLPCIDCQLEGIAPEHNLIVRAAYQLQQATNTQQGAIITIDKRIPMGSGLGGGSSNAATTLLALNQLWQLHLPLSTLQQLGRQLGADVPIFLHGEAAWAEGVGDILTPIPLQEPWYLVIYPGCQISTAEIFAAPHLTRDLLPVTLRDFQAGQTRNVCEPVVRSIYPQVGEALDWLHQHAVARLTGTGSCIFACFPDSTSASSVLQQLPKQWKGFIARGRNQSPARYAVDFPINRKVANS